MTEQVAYKATWHGNQQAVTETRNIAIDQEAHGPRGTSWPHNALVGCVTLRVKFQADQFGPVTFQDCSTGNAHRRPPGMGGIATNPSNAAQSPFVAVSLTIHQQDQLAHAQIFMRRLPLGALMEQHQVLL